MNSFGENDGYLIAYVITQRWTMKLDVCTKYCPLFGVQRGVTLVSLGNRVSNKRCGAILTNKNRS